MKKAMKTVFNRLFAKKQGNYPYAEWDKPNFKIPDELKLSETSSLGDVYKRQDMGPPVGDGNTHSLFPILHFCIFSTSIASADNGRVR